MDAMSWQCGALMKKMSPEHFYKCRGYYLHHKLGDYTTKKAKKQRLGKTDRGTWASRLRSPGQFSHDSPVLW